METLIALISSGKGTWSEVIGIVNRHNWKNVYLITNNFTNDKFSINKENVKIIKIDENNLRGSIERLSSEFRNIKDYEVALNISSGNGKEHMIVINSILKAGLGFKFLILDKNKIKVLDLIENKMIYDFENLI